MIKRSAGVLLPIFSLPSPYGIGSIGKEARAFADFLKEAGQSWWQILPVGPSGGGEMLRICALFYAFRVGGQEKFTERPHAALPSA